MIWIFKKTIGFIHGQLNRFRKINRTRTDAEEAKGKLESAAIDDKIIAAHKRMGGKGDLIDNVFE